MELRQCRFYIAVVDAQSITGAARRLNVVQSAVSHQIAKLERDMQTTLFLRSRNGVVPTESGRLLYLHAQAIVKHAEAARQSIRALDHEICGSVSLGLPSSTAAVLAIPLLRALRERFPQVELNIIEGLGSVLAEQLWTGRLDFSILFDDQVSKGFERTPLLKERLHFVSTLPEACAALRREEAITLREASKWPVILAPKTNSIRALVEEKAARIGVKLHIVASLSGVGTILEAVETGVASSIMMAANAIHLKNRDQAIVLPIRAPVIERTAAIVQAERFPLTPAASALRALLVEVVRELIARKRWPGAKPL